VDFLCKPDIVYVSFFLSPWERVGVRAYDDANLLEIAPPAPHIAVTLCLTVTPVGNIASKLSFDANKIYM
jgi:hypothetical protein